MITIHLHKILFYSYHGIHDEEKILGNEYELSADVQFHEEHEVIHSIHQTINYVDVFRIVKEEFKQRKQLLETCAMQISNRLQERFPNVEKLTISIRKLNPPITNFTGSIGVTYSFSIKEIEKGLK